MHYAKFQAYILIIKKMRTIYIKSNGFEKKRENHIYARYARVLCLIMDDAQITWIRKLSPIFD